MDKIAVRERNQNGQAMGRKGRETRRRLVDATVALLRTQRLRDLRVAEIAREASASPATFYLYFPDVSDAVLAGLEELTQSGEALLAMVATDWGKGDPAARGVQIVASYLQNWADHNALFRVRNLAADEGDVRFLTSRMEATSGLLHAFADAIRRARDAGWIDAALEPEASASVLMAMLERLAAVQFHYSHAEERRRDMIRAAGYMLAQMMGPPGGRG